MLFDWNTDTIKWFERASEYTQYHECLSKIINPMIEEYDSMCDIGCGLGIIDKYLAKNMKHITCMDISKPALDNLQNSVTQNGISNITIRQQDCETLSESYDCILISFFGSSRIESFLPYCKKLIVIMGGKSDQHMYPKREVKDHKNTYMDLADKMVSKGISYDLTTHSLEFGQPFLSEKEAFQYVKNLAKHADDEQIEDFLKKHIERVDDSYPYYIPHRKELGIFEIQGWLQ